MSLTSTVPAVVASFLDAINTDLVGVTAFESWPGPEAASEMVVLGTVRWDDYVIPTIKAGRKQRQENWTVDFEVYVINHPDATPANPTGAKDRAFAILASLENVLAVDPSAGSGFTVVQHVQLHPAEAEPRVFDKGWAYRIQGVVAVAARLT